MRYIHINHWNYFEKRMNYQSAIFRIFVVIDLNKLYLLLCCVHENLNIFYEILKPFLASLKLDNLQL